MRTVRLETWVAAALLALLANTAYLVGFPSATVFYMANAVLHVGLGLVLALGLQRLARTLRALSGWHLWGDPFWWLVLPSGLALAVLGNTGDTRWVLWIHLAASGLAVVALLFWLRRTAAERGGAWLHFQSALVAVLTLALVIPAGALLWRRTHPDPARRIRNSRLVPLRMEEEGGGPRSPFFPSGARTNVGGIIPADFFTDSKTCGECHKDIYRQWQGSVHHFASFNNQFYRKSIEYMQDVVGTRPSKWCAGCHDHAVFFNGRFDRPIREQIDTPEARAGLACTSCHSIVHVAGTVGNGSFTIAYPPLHELASSGNPALRGLNHFLTYLDPGPHKQTFMKAFMRQDASEFCSSCHKVHLDVPVNSYRWLRGFNEYDAWQASGVSGEGARSFYYPKEPKSCVGCHMPLVDSHDPGNRDGKVHSHRFPGANTAVPFVNGDREQLEATEKFLRSGFVTVDVFAVSPESDSGAAAAMRRRSDEAPRLASTFAVGEESEAAGPAVLRQAGPVAAPLDQSAVAPRPGSTVRVDVVVRTRAVGHFFPGGTVDAFDVWLELQATAADGQVVFWSGRVEDGGKGAVEAGAHFYRSLQLDAAGNPIDKRNAWQARSLLYAHLIPPGAADVAHFRLRIPPGTKGPLTLRAKLNYRKFSYYYTRFAYAGKPKPGQDPKLLSPDHNGLAYTFDPADVPPDVSGRLRGAIPDLPIVVVAEDTARLALGGDGPDAAAWRPVVRRADRERWNDWGIGLLLQGDLEGAALAFRRVTEAAPEYADGWLNMARTLIREGDIASARPYVAKALALAPGAGRVHFFKAMIEKEEGDYAAALASLAVAESIYPRDRVVLNQEARLLFLQRRYSQALAVLDRAVEVDPEDVQMHYTAMLCQRALGHAQQAARESALFRRFKADEPSQAITAIRRRISPEDNNERQAIHEHESVPLAQPAAGAPAPAPAAGGRR